MLGRVLRRVVQTAVAKSGKGAVQGVVQTAVAKSRKGAVQGALQGVVQECGGEVWQRCCAGCCAG